VYRNYYVIAVMNAGTFVDCLVCDLPKRTWFRFSNIRARAFWAAKIAAEELFIGLRSAARVGKFSPVFLKEASNKNDADTTAVTMSVELPFDDSPFGLKSYGHVYVGCDVRDAGADDPTWTVSFCTSPEDGASYTALSPTISESSGKGRKRVPLRRSKVQGVGLKLHRTNAASDARLYSVEVERQVANSRAVN
jgi:hypothetical protein